jgi:hypothetical protein
MKIAGIQQANKFRPNKSQLIGQKPEPEKSPVLKSLEPMLEEVSKLPSTWVSEPTAIIIMHGIGNQNPLETLDDFARGFIEAYRDKLPEGERKALELHHEIAVKTSNGEPWFDNIIRLTKGEASPPIDIYEYYWANHTENKISFAGIQQWITSVVREAKSFYEDNMNMEMDTGRRTSFFKAEETDTTTGAKTYKFRSWRYSWFLRIVGLLLPMIKFFSGILRWAIKKQIPIVGSIAESIYCKLEEKISLGFANVIGDIAIYNTADVKSELFEIRRNILAGAVDAIKYLVEPDETTKQRRYGKVLIAGHSLGTQIAYDAINRIDHLINFGKVNGIDTNGHLLTSTGATEGKRVDELLGGFITFGSPLDKIAFFLREHVDPQRILMLQIINDYHSFRQRDWYGLVGMNKPHLKLETDLKKLFEQIPWRNYFDRHDYVSGSLDFYDGVTNIDCDFKNNAVPIMVKGKRDFKKSGAFSFTHGWYWNYQPMFTDIIESFLLPVNQHPE